MNAAARELSSKDLRRVLEVAHVLGEDDSDGELAPRLLECIGAVVGCEMVTYTGINVTTGGVVFNVTRPGYPCITTREGFAEANREFPGFVAMAEGRLPPDGPTAMSDLVDRRSMRRLALYVDHHRPFDIEDQLFRMVSRGPRQVNALMVNRSRTGYCRRDRAVMDLLAWFLGQAVRRRARYRGAAVIGRQAAQVRQATERLAILTTRERQVVEQLGTGASDREIARALTISERTVQKHLENVYSKLGVGSRAGALAAVLVDHSSAAPSGPDAG